MPLATKGIRAKRFSSAAEAIRWAEKQHLGQGAESEEELKHFRFIATNVPAAFWTSQYGKVEAHFDSEGALDAFFAYDKAGVEDSSWVRKYP